MIRGLELLACPLISGRGPGDWEGPVIYKSCLSSGTFITDGIHRASGLVNRRMAPQTVRGKKLLSLGLLQTLPNVLFIWLFICVLYNIPAVVSKVFLWVLWASIANIELEERIQKSGHPGDLKLASEMGINHVRQAPGVNVTIELSCRMPSLCLQKIRELNGIKNSHAWYQDCLE